MPLEANEIDGEGVAQALAEVLESQFFRPTAQCSALLRYIVDNTVAKRDENLRERVIGYEVFHRAPDYDTGNDHVVRSRAAEVRKRLALYYQEVGPSMRIRIGVPSGSYRAVFHIQESKTADRQLLLHTDPIDTPADSAKSLPTSNAVVSFTENFALKVWRAAAVIAVLVAVTIALWPHNSPLRRATDYDRFWSPLLHSSKPPLIYCGGGFVYKLSDEYLDRYKSQHSISGQRREFFVNLKPGESVSATDLIADRHFVPFGDLAASARIASTLTQAGRSYDLRYGDDLAFTELHSSPVILIGGLNNTWALRVTHDLRYVLDGDDRIIDRTNPNAGKWIEQVDAEKQSRDDYAVISWLNQSETGGFVLSIAGIRMYSNRAAADFLTNPAQLDSILAKAPRGWEKRNLQIVIHTRTVNDIPVSTNVESMQSW